MHINILDYITLHHSKEGIDLKSMNRNHQSLTYEDRPIAGRTASHDRLCLKCTGGL